MSMTHVITAWTEGSISPEARLLYVEADVKHVAILNNVVLSF